MNLLRGGGDTSEFRGKGSIPSVEHVDQTSQTRDKLTALGIQSQAKFNLSSFAERSGNEIQRERERRKNRQNTQNNSGFVRVLRLFSRLSRSLFTILSQ